MTVYVLEDLDTEREALKVRLAHLYEIRNLGTEVSAILGRLDEINRIVHVVTADELIPTSPEAERRRDPLWKDPT